MTTLGFALLDTVIGDCGIAWVERGLTGVTRAPPARSDRRWATFNLAYHAWEGPILRTLAAASAKGEPGHAAHR